MIHKCLWNDPNTSPVFAPCIRFYGGLRCQKVPIMKLFALFPFPTFNVGKPVIWWLAGKFSSKENSIELKQPLQPERHSCGRTIVLFFWKLIATLKGSTHWNFISEILNFAESWELFLPLYGKSSIENYLFPRYTSWFPRYSKFKVQEPSLVVQRSGR